jgi:hypothetical protein
MLSEYGSKGKIAHNLCAYGIPTRKETEMKTVYATAGSDDNPISTTVQLNNHDEKETLSPAMARSAARIGFGHTQGVTVSDGKSAFRMTKSGTRRIKIEPDF